MKFVNNTSIDVYVDLGTLRRVAPGEVVELPGALTCQGLSPIHEPAPKRVKKAPPKKAKKTSTSGTI